MFKHVLEKLGKEVSGDIAFNFVSEISRHHRIQASPGLRAAVNYAVETLRGYGLDAGVHEYPADANPTAGAASISRSGAAGTQSSG